MWTLLLPLLVHVGTYWLTAGLCFDPDQPNPPQPLDVWQRPTKAPRKGAYPRCLGLDPVGMERVARNQLLWSPVTFALFFWVCPPSDWSLLWAPLQLALCHGLTDVLTYGAHRAFHTAPLKAWHETHHRWMVVSPAAAYDAHPLEHVVVNLLPMLIASALARCNYWTVCAWIFWTTDHVVWSHSNGDAAHRQHHATRRSNYGTYGRWTDKLLGTFAELPDHDVEV
jgi:sterol desaturase/sphingolipid hydroxylase (fatty acid hydroxylase superfamily)